MSFALIAVQLSGAVNGERLIFNIGSVLRIEAAIIMPCIDIDKFVQREHVARSGDGHAPFIHVVGCGRRHGVL